MTTAAELSPLPSPLDVQRAALDPRERFAESEPKELCRVARRVLTAPPKEDFADGSAMRGWQMAMRYHPYSMHHS